MAQGFCAPFFRLMFLFLSIALMCGSVFAVNVEAGSISGRVANVDGVGVGNVSIHLFKGDGSPASNSAISSQDGSYAISGLVSGSYKIVYYAPYGSGYLSQWYSNKNDFNSADPIAVLSSGNTIANIALVTGGIISGRVTNSSGQGIANVGVGLYVSNDSSVASTATTADGTYAINGLSGAYKIRFNAPSGSGYLSQWHANKDDQNSADAVIVNAPGTSTVNAMLSSGGVVSGRVSNTEGSGIADVTVGLYDLSCFYITSAPTASDGSYAIDGRISGNYKVRYYFPYGPSQYLSRWHSNKNDCFSADVVAITAPNATMVNAVLATGGSISGRVTNAGGEGIANVYVWIFGSDGLGVGSSRTGADGRYARNGLESGNYKIQFDAFADANYRSQWYQNKINLSSADSIAVTAPNESVANAVLVAKGSISGRVTNTDGAGVPSVSVRIYPQSGWYVGWASTAADGTYTIRGLEPGSYTAEFTNIAAGYTSQWFSNKSDQANANLIMVADDTVAAANVVLYSKGAITGRVTNAGGAGISNVYVSIFDAVSAARVASGVFTSQDGTYTVRGLATGTYKVFYSPGWTSGYLERWFDNKTDIAQAAVVHVTEPQTSVANIVLPSGAVISGMVTGPNGASIGSVNINIYRDGSYLGNHWTESNGNYSIVGLESGGYKLQFETPWWDRYQSQWHNNKPDINTADVLAVSAPNTYTVNVSLAACTFTIKSPPAFFGKKGGTASFILSSDTISCLTGLQGTSPSDWISVAYRSTDSRAPEMNVEYTVAENASGALRTGTIAIADQVFSVTQSHRVSPGGTVQSIGSLPGAFSSEVSGISADGSTVIGTAYLFAEDFYWLRAFRWNQTQGMIDIGLLPGWSDAAALGVSSDGSVVVGAGWDLDGNMRAFRWDRINGMVDLGLAPDWIHTAASAVSADGSVIVGEAFDSAYNTHAFRWDVVNGYVKLALPSGLTGAAAHSVSADGAVAGGFAEGSTGSVHAVRWSQVSGVTDFGGITDTVGGTNFAASFNAISEDGTAVAGSLSSSSATLSAFRWTSASGFADLGGWYDSSEALGISPDGSVVVGWATALIDYTERPRAFRWTPSDGLLPVAEWLLTNGVDVAGAEFSDASAVSADGNAIAGRLSNGNVYRAEVQELVFEPAFTSISSAGGNETISVFAVKSDKHWTAISNSLWITITSGNSGTGAGSVQFSVGANTTGVVRKGSITIGGQTYNVIQGTTSYVEKIGIYANGNWYLDGTADGVWNGAALDQTAYFGFAGAVPVRGDWDGNGIPRIGVYHDGYWYLDMNADGAWNGADVDKTVHFGFSGALPVVGDWNSTGATKVGVYANGYWYLDMNGNGVWDGELTDKICHFGFPGAIPVTGHWSGTGTDHIGVYANGHWYLDMDGDCAWNGANDAQRHFGFAGALPVTGDWNNMGISKIGVYADGHWYLDVNGNGAWDGNGTDASYYFGFPGAVPLSGSW